MKKFIFFVFILFFTPLESALSQSKVGDPVFTCETEADARSCNSNCKSLEGVTTEVKVNSSNHTVIRNDYRNSNLMNSIALNGECKVIDSKNWVCIDPSLNNNPNPKLMGKYVESMTNGKYFYQLEVYSTAFKSFTCMK